MTLKLPVSLNGERAGRTHPVQRVMKSCLDFVGAGILIILPSPVFVLVGVLVYKEVRLTEGRRSA